MRVKTSYVIRFVKPLSDNMSSIKPNQKGDG